MDPLDPSKIEQYRKVCEETPEPEPLEAEELHDVWQHGNQRRPVPPKLSDKHKAGLVDLKRRWITFAATAESAIRAQIRKLGGLYRKYKGCLPERPLMDHLRNVIRSETTKTWKLRREPKIKPIMGSDFFTSTTFTTAGCRKHELVYAKPRDLEAKVKEYDEESDAYTDVLLRYHKGENKNIVPTWYIFVEEKLLVLCPITHILTKALAEGIIASEGYQTKADPSFATKLNKRALKIR
ncbi:hypothetical protein B0T26DRAFT_750260 [Lasiosphaeria miniovina]|uniref:Uncharacterized protein n=1 Tax=Lasiosphaeria miniovina TaxID=1954250 RepID=A0AA40AVR1_9PEZI|nr:uncharacterized protein B0T26DRAFT_750260 [Lasiosphaeria miniovina]KAK0722920.1 hypothetical protein B0T26DRAFT_750260 [Lasiosphaeria miniovina]